MATNPALHSEPASAPSSAPPETQPATADQIRERRMHARFGVDTPVQVLMLTGSDRFEGRLLNLSLSGCCVELDQKFVPWILARVELQFQLRGIAFHMVGMTAGTRSAKIFALRFLEMPPRRHEELAEVLREVQTANAVKAMENLADATTHASKVSAGSRPEVPQPNRRSHGRHLVDTSARVLLVENAVSIPGRILNLSQGGCRLCPQEPFVVGMHVHLETEFYIHGLPFRLAGVSQAVIDAKTIGVRFLDMSDRKREQLTELIAEIAELEAAQTAAMGEAALDAPR